MSKVINLVGGSISNISLQSIYISSPPEKTQYLSGETFNSNGMEVTALYSNGASKVLYDYSINYSGALIDGVTQIEIEYTEFGISKKVYQTVTVIPIVVRIFIQNPPNKVSYEYGESFDETGIMVGAEYSDGAISTVSNLSFYPESFSSIGTQEVTVSYTENGITKTTTQEVNVNRATIQIPNQSGTLVYNGSSISPIWNNYDSNKMITGGTTSSINSGTYVATFTPKSNYRWPDNTTTSKNISWTITKASGYLSISPTSISFNSSSRTKTITVTRYGDGAITASSNNTSVATVSVSGNKVTVTGTGTDGNATITVRVAEGTNYTAPSNKTCSVSANYYPIGSQIILSTVGSGSWECPASGSWTLELHGGGGGAAGAMTANLPGTGGQMVMREGAPGGSSGNKQTVTLVGGNSYSYNIGSAGSSGYSGYGGEDGSNGGRTTFGSYSVNGGGGATHTVYNSVSIENVGVSYGNIAISAGVEEKEYDWGDTYSVYTNSSGGCTVSDYSFGDGAPYNNSVYGRPKAQDGGIILTYLG